MIQFHHVGKRYAGQERPALEDLTFTVKKGEFCILTGASGAGKTTLLRLLYCAERPTYGRIIFNNQDIAAITPSRIPFVRRNIGIVFQDFKLIGYMTALENVGLALWVQKKPPDEILKKSLTMLKSVGLSSKAYVPCAHLSGGEQQRVAIARALVSRPALLLCDEPTGNLDARRAAEIIELLIHANQSGATLILATHDPALLELQDKKIISLTHGRLAASNRSKFPAEV